MTRQKLKHTINRIFALLLSLNLLLVTCFTYVSADEAYDLTCTDYADCNVNGTCYEVVEDNVRVRDAPSKSAETLGYVSSINLVSVKGFVTNDAGNDWAIIGYTDDSGEHEAYIYSERLALHQTHQMLESLTTEAGNVSICVVCGYSVATSYEDNETAECDLKCVADQALLGNYSGNATFWGLVSRIIVGELPFAGTAADVRDLVYDLTNNGSALDITMDVAALLPLIGAVKYAAKLDDLKYLKKSSHAFKYSDDIAKPIEKITWGAWEDYEHVSKGGRTYAKIGDFLYTKEAVNHFVPKSILHYVPRDTLSGVVLDEARGVSPAYIQHVLKAGIADGSTIKVAAGDTRFTDLVKRGVIKDSKYTVFCSGSLDVITDDDVVVTVITTKRTTNEYLEIVKAANN